MAGDWIKMRTNLLTDPKVLAMTAYLAADRDFTAWWLAGTRLDVRHSVTEVVTTAALRLVTAGGLLLVWAAANEHTDDGFFPGIDLDGLDDIAGIASFGAAMRSVGWASEDAGRFGVSLPNFSEYNTTGPRRPLTNAQRQALHRAKKRAENSNEIRNGRNEIRNGEVTESNENRNAREEKIREYKTPPYPPHGGACETPVSHPGEAPTLPGPGNETPDPAGNVTDPAPGNAPAGSGGSAGGSAGGRGSKSAEPPGFEEFWRAYPRKTAKDAARKAWRKLAPDADLQALLAEALQRQAGWEQWRRGVIPHASTWLNQRRWEDEGPAGGPGGPGGTTEETPLERAARLQAEREAFERQRDQSVRGLPGHREEAT